MRKIWREINCCSYSVNSCVLLQFSLTKQARTVERWVVFSTQLIIKVLSQRNHLSIRCIWNDGRRQRTVKQWNDVNFQLTFKVSEENKWNRILLTTLGALTLLSQSTHHNSWFCTIWGKLVKNVCTVMDSQIKFPLGDYSDGLNERILLMIMTIIKIISNICMGHYSSYSLFTYVAIFNIHKNAQVLYILFL